MIVRTCLISCEKVQYLTSRIYNVMMLMIEVIRREIGGNRNNIETVALLLTS